MATRRKTSAGTGSAGIHHVAKIVSSCNCIFQPIDQQNDIGNDGYIEFIVDEASTGCCIAAQIKSGSSFIRNGKFIIPASEAHFEYWRSHVLPICGFVYDPKADIARWVDITSHVASFSEKNHSLSIEVPSANVFDSRHFEDFRNHFLAHRARFADLANFGRSLVEFSHLENPWRCGNAIKSLFSFHRNRAETWYFLISSLPHFRENRLLEFLIESLTHIPGHMDILWGPRNVISQQVRQEAESIFKQFLSRDSILTLISAIEPENGIGRGSIGQCVHAIIAMLDNKRELLKSIIFDSTVQEDLRYWSVILLAAYEQFDDPDFAARIVEKAEPTFSQGDDRERLDWLKKMLKAREWVDFS